MQLNRHADDEFAIRALDARGVQIAGEWWQAPFALNRAGPEALDEQFAELGQITPKTIDQFLAHRPADVAEHLERDGAVDLHPGLQE